MFFCAPLLLQSCVHIDVIEGSEWERDGLLSPARDDDRPEEVLDCSRDPLRSSELSLLMLLPCFRMWFTHAYLM